MSEPGEWIDVGAAEDFKRTPLREAKLGERLVAISYKDGKFGVHLQRLQSRGRAAGQEAVSRSEMRGLPLAPVQAFIAARARASRVTRPTRSRATA